MNLYKCHVMNKKIFNNNSHGDRLLISHMGAMVLGIIIPVMTTITSLMMQRNINIISRPGHDRIVCAVSFLHLRPGCMFSRQICVCTGGSEWVCRQRRKVVVGDRSKPITVTMIRRSATSVFRSMSIVSCSREGSIHGRRLALASFTFSGRLPVNRLQAFVKPR